MSIRGTGSRYSNRPTLDKKDKEPHYCYLLINDIWARNAHCSTIVTVINNVNTQFILCRQSYLRLAQASRCGTASLNKIKKKNKWNNHFLYEVSEYALFCHYWKKVVIFHYYLVISIQSIGFKHFHFVIFILLIPWVKTILKIKIAFRICSYLKAFLLLIQSRIVCYHSG